MRFHSMVAAVLAIAALPMPAATAAPGQPYPSRPIRLVVPYPAGGGTDVVARLLARKMGESMGQPVVIENRPGASTIIGTDAVAKAPSDGYTVGLVTDSHAINFAFGRKLPYRESDFTPITQLLNVPLVLLANAAVPAKTIRDLVILAKSRPGQLHFASIGSGSPHELAMHWFNQVAGTDIPVVVYKGIAPALNDTLGGQVELMFAGSGVADQHIKAGKLRTIAITAPNRMPANPAVPTIAENYPEFVVNTWYGIVAPANLSPAVTAKLRAEFVKALQSPDVHDQISALGAQVVGGTPADLKSLIRTDTAKWGRIIKMTGATPE